MVRVQVPVPEQPPPLQPEKVEAGSGWAIRVTVTPRANFLEQLGMQVIHPGLMVTVPTPLPAFATDSVKVCTCAIFSNTGEEYRPITPPAATMSRLPSALKSPTTAGWTPEP